MDDSSANRLAALAEKLDEETVRIETVIWLPAASSSFCESKALCDFSEESEEVLRECFPDIPQELLDELGKDVGTELLVDWLNTENLRGFAIQFARPVMRHTAAGSTFSWGYYNTSWRYGATFDEAVQAGLAWAEQRRQAEMATPTPEAAS